MTDNFEERASYAISKNRTERIQGFYGPKYAFLNNSFASYVIYEGLSFPSVNAAYQAARTDKQHIREKISMIDNENELWEIAVEIEDPPNWINDRMRIMELLIRSKFRINRELREALQETGRKELINLYDEATQSNLFWGLVDGKGQNHLGRIIEAVRSDIKMNEELAKWLMFTFKIEENSEFLPRIYLKVHKDNEVIEKIVLEKKGCYFLGQLQTNHVILAHPSISKQHAALFIDNDNKINVVDVGSQGGSQLNDVDLLPYIPYQIKTGEILKFALSTRSYEVDIDRTDVQRNISKRIFMLERELKAIEKITNADNEQIKDLLSKNIDDTLYVFGLPKVFSSVKLRDIFEKIGNVKKVLVQIDKQTGKQRNCAFVTFQSEAELRKVIPKSDGLMYDDHQFSVKIAEQIKLLNAMNEFDLKEPRWEKNPDVQNNQGKQNSKFEELKKEKSFKEDIIEEPQNRDQESNQTKPKDEEDKRIIKKNKESDAKHQQNKNQNEQKNSSKNKQKRADSSDSSQNLGSSSSNSSSSLSSSSSDSDSIRQRQKGRSRSRSNEKNQKQYNDRQKSRQY